MLARRLGRTLCLADQQYYNMVNLEAASFLPLLPISQAPDESVPIRPSITAIDGNEFLLLSWTGNGTIGIFITGDGDPVRGTLEWPAHPEAVCELARVRFSRFLMHHLAALDYPYVTTLLPNDTIEIHNIETQSIVQVVPAPPEDTVDRKLLLSCANGFFVPSSQSSDKLRPVPIRLVRGKLNVAEGNGPARGELPTIPAETPA